MKSFKTFISEGKKITIKVNDSKLMSLQKQLPDTFITTQRGSLLGNILIVDEDDRSFVARGKGDNVSSTVMDTIIYRYGISSKEQIKKDHDNMLEKTTDESKAIKTCLDIAKELKSWHQVNEAYQWDGKVFRSKLYMKKHVYGPGE